MITIPAGLAQARPALARRWRITAGLASLAAGAAMLTGAFLPWVETFAGLIAIPGVRGSYGRILAGAGAGIAAAGLYQLIRGGRWARWLTGLAGFAAAGFSGYLLIQLTATMRVLGGDSMVLARGGPGLWVTGAGALAAFGTLFLPLATPVKTASEPAAIPRDRPAWRAAADAWAAWAVRIRRAVLRRTADFESAGRRRGLQVALGLAWLADAALQFQPYMFGHGFVSAVLTPAAAGNPAVMARPQLWAGHLISHNVAAWNSAFALTQLAIAVGLLWRPTVRAALIVSIGWAVTVWWLGEGLNGVLTGIASPVTGAPGAVILYALLAVLAWPGGSVVTDRASIATASPLGRWAKTAWILLWGSLSYLILQPPVRAPRSLSSTLSAGAAGEPGWLAAVDRWAATAAGTHGLAISVAFGVLFALIAAGVLVPATTRPALILAAVLALAIWVIGENFGMILTGMGTDPNTGPLLVLLAAAFWPLRPAATPPPAAPLTPVTGRQVHAAAGTSPVRSARGEP